MISKFRLTAPFKKTESDCLEIHLILDVLDYKMKKKKKKEN